MLGSLILTVNPLFCYEVHYGSWKAKQRKYLLAGETGMCCHKTKSDFAMQIGESFYRISFSQSENLFFFSQTKRECLKDKSVCFTGNMRWNRDIFYKIVDFCGGEHTPRVNTKTTLLVLADNNQNCSENKVETAKRYGIQVISEKDFLESLSPFQVASGDEPGAV